MMPQQATLKRICIHWTAGGTKANELDRSHYHFIVQQDSNIITGNLPPEANIPRNGSTLSGQPEGTYVAHCGGGNSFTIGVSLCGMMGQNADKSWQYPLTRSQCETAWQLVAQLCAIYNIAVTPDTVFTHYEFGLCNPNTPSAGKIDISVLPFEPTLKPNQVGNYIRTRISGYLAKIQQAGSNAAPKQPSHTAAPTGGKPPVPSSPRTTNSAPVPR